MEYFENRFVRIEVNPKHAFISFTSRTSRDTIPEVFKHNMLIYRQMASHYACQYLLIDNREMDFVITPDLQEWVVREVAPYTLSLKRIAIVVSPDLYAQISMEQMMEEEGIADKYPTPRYFREVQEAYSWLFS